MFKSRTLRGIRLSHKKHTRFCETIEMPVPATVTIPMRQHIGAACDPIVAVGDTVYVGQKVGDSPAFVSSPVHSPVSGVVKAREIVLMPNGVPTPSLTIESDGLQTPWSELKPPTKVLLQDNGNIRWVWQSNCRRNRRVYPPAPKKVFPTGLELFLSNHILSFIFPDFWHCPNFCENFSKSMRNPIWLYILI